MSGYGIIEKIVNWKIYTKLEICRQIYDYTDNFQTNDILKLYNDNLLTC